MDTRIRALLEEQGLSTASMEGLAAYVETLLETNKSLNLTGLKTRWDIWDELILDSLRALPFIPEGEVGDFLDIGSGGGIPGIPLALARPALYVTLLESRQKKCRFLDKTFRDLGLARVDVVCERSETLGHRKEYRERYSFCGAKGLAPLPVLLELAAPFLKTGGILIAWKGGHVEEELRAAENAMSILNVKITDTIYYETCNEKKPRTLLLFRKFSSTSMDYPRKIPLPRRQPL